MPSKKTNSKSGLKPIAKKKSPPVTDSLEKISSTDPIPFETGVGFSIALDIPYIPFLESTTDDKATGNVFPQLLLQCRLLSPTNFACVDTKKDYCKGIGFQTSTEEDIKDKNFTNWMMRLNNQGDTGVGINGELFESHFTFGNTPIELVRFTLKGKKYLNIYVHNMLEWRLGKEDEDGEVKYAMQSKLFLRNQIVLVQEDIDKTRTLPLYNPMWGDKTGTKVTIDNKFNWLRDGKGVERTLIWYKNKIAGFPHYGLPSNIASLLDQKLEYRAARYDLDNFDNNMVISALLALKGSLSKTEVNAIAKRLVFTHVGEGKTGRVAVVASEEGIDGSDFHQMETHKEGSFVESSNSWRQTIILANKWDAILAGLISTNTMGKGLGFLSKLLEIKKNTVIRPAQADAMEKVWKPIFRIAQKWFGWKGIDIEDIQIKNDIDISGLTDVDITPAVTVNEVRQAKGMAEAKDKKKGEMFLGELAGNQKKGIYVADQSGQQQTDANVQPQ